MADAHGSRPGRKFVTTESILAKYPASTRELITELRTAVGDSYGSLKAFYKVYTESVLVRGRRLPYPEVSRQLGDGSRFRNGPDDQLFESIVTLCFPERSDQDRVRALRHRVLAPPVQSSSPELETTKSTSGAPDNSLKNTVPERRTSDSVDDAPEGDASSSRTERGSSGARWIGPSFLAVILVLVFLLYISCEPLPPATKLMGVGCEIPPGPLAAVVSGRSNSPVPSATDEFLEVAAAAQRDGLTKMSIVNLDGRPTIERLEMPTARDSAGRITEKSDDRVRRFMEHVKAVRARTEQADVLAALDLAGREIQASGKGGTVFMLDSGLATMGPLDFSLLSLNNWPIEIVDELRRAKLLPNLQGATVVFAGIGDTAPPQQQLPASLRQQLIDIWTGIARASGAACVTAISRPRTEPAPDGGPPVKLVTVKNPPPVEPQPGARQILGDEAATFFRPNSAELADPEAARVQLARVASWLNQDPKRRANIVGTTANQGSKEGQRALSLSRAKAIASLLVSSGVQPGQITTSGVGSDFPEYVNDRGADGEVLPNEAQKNRTIQITLS